MGMFVFLVGMSTASFSFGIHTASERNPFVNALFWVTPTMSHMRMIFLRVPLVLVTYPHQVSVHRTPRCLDLSNAQRAECGIGLLDAQTQFPLATKWGCTWHKRDHHVSRTNVNGFWALPRCDQLNLNPLDIIWSVILGVSSVG